MFGNHDSHESIIQLTTVTGISLINKGIELRSLLDQLGFHKDIHDGEVIPVAITTHVSKPHEIDVYVLMPDMILHDTKNHVSKLHDDNASKNDATSFRVRLDDVATNIFFDVKISAGLEIFCIASVVGVTVAVI